MKKNIDDGCLAIKVQEYKIAIEKYNHNSLYTRIEFFFGLFIVALQIITIIILFDQYQKTHLVDIFLTIFFAYMTTDFINGLTHMIVDNNTNYQSITGPFVAAFHLHHQKLVYKKNNIFKIYFYESGHKIWLFFYLVILFFVQCFLNVNFCLNLFLVMIGLLSSVAELSHYWCHSGVKKNSLIRLLQKYHLLLSMKHHRHHHLHDNKHYAFLNGMTDPLLNIIAKYFYTGYKNQADVHVALYEKHTSAEKNIASTSKL